MKRNWSEVASLLGGRHLLERKSLLILSPYLILTSAIAVLIQTLDESPLESQLLLFPWLPIVAANLLSLSVCWLALELLNKTLLRNKDVRPISVVMALLAGFGLGALKGFSTGVFGLWFEVFSTYEDAVGGRWIQTGILGVFLVPILTLSVAKIEQINQKQEILIADHVSSLLSGNLAPTESLRRQVNELKESSLKMLDELEYSIPKSDANAAKLFQTTIQSLLANHVRPMSHTIWQDKKSRMPRLTLPTLIGSGILGKSLNPIVSTTLIFAILFLSHLVILAPVEAFQRSLTISLTTALLTRGYGFINMKSSFLYVFGYFATVIGSAALGTLLADWIFGSVQNGSFLLAWLATAILSLQTILMATVGSQMITKERDLDSELETLLSEDQIEDRARAAYSAVVNRDYAQFLHSDVQNQLLISVLAAKQENFTAADLQREVSRLRALFAGLEQERAVLEEVLFSEIAQGLEQRWDGFIALETVIRDDLQDKPCDRSWALLEVLNEAISNSIRHGMASRVLVELNRTGSDIAIVITDDGLGVTKGKPGLGSRIIQEITAGNWSLESGASGGSVLKLQLKTGT